MTVSAMTQCTWQKWKSLVGASLGFTQERRTSADTAHLEEQVHSELAACVHFASIRTFPPASWNLTISKVITMDFKVPFSYCNLNIHKSFFKL